MQGSSKGCSTFLPTGLSAERYNGRNCRPSGGGVDAMQKSFAAQPQIESYDPVWMQVRREAEEASVKEPALASFIYATVLSENGLEDAVCHRLAERLKYSVDAALLFKIFAEAGLS